MPPEPKNQSGSWLREPLLHFILLGAALFFLFGAVTIDVRDTPNEIVIDEYAIANVVAGFEQTWRREPTEDELDQLIDSWIRDEILYREGLAMNLQSDDPVVRRRVIQKFSFLIEGMVPGEPAEADLEQWFAEHAEDYRKDAIYSFRQIFFDPARHGSQLEDVIANARQSLADPLGNLPGDPTLLPDHVDNAPASAIARGFDSAFAAALAELPEGEWSGPVESAYGAHLVFIEFRKTAQIPSLDEVRAEVAYDLTKSRAEDAAAAVFDELKARYTIRYNNDVLVADREAD